jgi:hypothetical protein
LIENSYESPELTFAGLQYAQATDPLPLLESQPFMLRLFHGLGFGVSAGQAGRRSWTVPMQELKDVLRVSFISA